MKTRIVILAAGEGKRMNSGTPKVLALLGGKPIIRHTLDAIKASGVDPHPVVVVGHGKDAVRDALGGNLDYVVQKEALGTGHAVSCAREALGSSTSHVIVLYGDHPFVKPSTISELQAVHTGDGSPITMMTTTVPDFDDWRSLFYRFGRVVRNKGGRIQAIVENKDATEEQLEICEVNPGYYCFNAEWMWQHLPRIGNDNAAGEHYLTDLVKIAIDDGESVASISIEPSEAVGINTPEELKFAEELLKNN